MPVVTIVVALLAGLAAGAAARPLIFARAVPRGEPARTACTSCSTHYPAPGLRGRLQAVTGRCPACGAKTGPPAGLPEALTAAAFAALAATGAGGWIGAAQYWLAACGAALSIIDLKVHRLPDVLTLPASIGTILLLAGAALAGEPGSFLRALAAAGVVTAAYLVLVVTGMGMGDVKLAPAIGALLGWSSWTVAVRGVFAGFLLASAVGFLLLLIRRVSARSHLAFGPHMIIGALVLCAAST
ncbi:A24 family peptidase [Streptomyces sp. OfavH-34-F]|uniref:prepilin peptidase n=1 Tax=Streptomyces sp. OfavH-34-F TaxID=2917760 RepID=UPI001EF39415|nr:A24 family peptidase [Streptomyces sp. OfavH-34-F]MCG7523855.1 A24 family peptidase [Streptomyces sp. OfavH-34-F]